MRTRILPPLMLSIIILMGAFLYTFHRTYQQRLTELRETTGKRAEDLTRAELRNYVDVMSAALKAIIRDERLESALAAGNREEAIALADPLFHELQTQLHIDHFYFHKTDRTSLARMHEREKFGDRIDRITLLEAEKTGNPSSGIEQGPTGNCTLRVVYPWRRDGKLIGYVELGTEFETVAQRVHDILQVHLVALVDKKHLDRKRWENRNQKLGRQTAWDAFADFVVIDKTMETLPPALTSRLSAGKIVTGEDAIIDVDGKATQVVFLPLADVTGRSLGNLVVLRDIQELTRSARHSVIVVSTISCAVGILLLGFFYAFLGRVGSDLQGRSDQLAQANAKLGQVNAQLGDANARLEQANATLETRVRERTEQLEEAHRKLVDTARQAGMAEVATGVLHNVGNALNSVNISANVVSQKIRQTPVGGLGKAAQMIREHQQNLGEFFTSDKVGCKIPSYLIELGEHLTAEQNALLDEVKNVVTGIEHIKQIVGMQQSYAKNTAVVENIRPSTLMDSAVAMNAEALADSRVEVVREYEEVAAVGLDKHRIIQILVNVLSNARHAVKGKDGGGKKITLRVGAFEQGGKRHIRFEVADNGVGIPAENLTRIFTHGFTTRVDGHGFGLHSAANAAGEMGGSLRAASEGHGKGAVFTLEVPVQQNEPVTCQR
ncbi:MAG TPA: cache domain-containing protein [Tepidisphaeraceae bacterium]|nr:cache domain-containing protein [Tepidisphaeraceae bacterium]